MIIGNMGLMLTDNFDLQALVEQHSTTRRALDYNGTQLRPITDSLAKQNDLDLRSNEPGVSYQVLMDACYQVLKGDLYEPQRRQSWGNLIDDILEK